MLRRHFTIALLAAAVAACSETPTQSSATLAPRPETPTLQTYPGVLVAPNLLRSGQMLIPLAGWQTRLFQGLVGAEILVEGHMDADPESGLEINEFQLLAVDGHPVLDGKLEAREDGFFVRARAGTMHPVYDVPEPLAHLVGRRVFVAHEAGAALRYGLLELED